MPRPTRLVPAALLALTVWLAPTCRVAGAAPATRQVTRTVLPALPGTPPDANTQASDIDNHGRVVGSSGDKPVMWQDGEVVELTGFPDDVVVSAASQINDRGQVVAVGYTAAEAYNRDYLWHDGRVDRIEVGPGQPARQVHDLNDQGQALVSGTDAAGRDVVGLWEDGAFTEVAEWNDRWPVADPTAWRFTSVRRLSNGGYVVGWESRGACNPAPAPSDCETRAVVWHDGELTPLPGRNGNAFGVNTRGDIIGVTQQGGVVWRDGQPIPLGFTPHDINDRGQIVGRWQWWNILRAVLWDDGRVVDLGTLGGWSTRPFAINESGQVIGYSETAAGEMHAFLWDDGEMIDLTPDADGSLPDPWLIAMNDHGQVVGYSEGRLPDNAELWEVSEPAGP